MENKKYEVKRTETVIVHAVDEEYAEMIGLQMLESGLGALVNIDVEVEEVKEDDSIGFKKLVDEGLGRLDQSI